MSILSGVASALAGRGSGYTKFPEGTHLVRLAEVNIRTEWSENKPMTFKWSEGNEVPAVGIEPKFIIIGDGVSADSKPQSVETIVLPTSAPPADLLDAIAQADEYVAGLPGVAYRFSIARRSLNSFLNVAMGQDPNSFVENPDDYLAAIMDMIGSGSNPEFQVSVKYEPRKNDPTKTNTRVNYALSS